MRFEFRLILLLFIAAAAAVLAALLTFMQTQWPWLSLLVGLLVALLAAVLARRHFLAPLHRLTRAMETAVASYRDGDYSMAIRHHEGGSLADLTRLHAELGRALREQRQHLAQRELLLDTVVQHSPLALLLVDDQAFIVYSNLAARHLLNEGRSLNGVQLTELVDSAPDTLRDALKGNGDALFPVEFPDGEEMFHLAQRPIRLQGRAHRLYLLRRMTRELARQEVSTWKKVIRVMSHELNNSLAPISSMAHSGEELLRLGQTENLGAAFHRIGERARHLQQFIGSYARFARLPEPRKQRIAIGVLLEGIVAQIPLRLICSDPEASINVDVTQMEQALINLAKNAQEAGGPADAVELEVSRNATEWRLEVRDRGSGMSETVLANAVLPFYSTKRSGTGIGLALVREIIEAHGGHMDLANREGGGLRVRLVVPAD